VGISSDPVALNNQNEALVKQNHVLQSNNDVLIADIEILENDRRNQSFLYGGLTVFMGALLAILIPKLRGRKKFSEWG
jgi:SH3 domain protein